MSSTLSFLDQFNTPSTEGGKRLSIYTPKHTHVGDSTLLTLLLSNPTNVFNKLKAHNPEATNATDRAALEAYLSARREYDEAVKAADKAIDHHKRLLRQQDNRVLTELIRLDNLKDCPDVRCAGCGKEAPGHLERECGTRPMKRHVSAPPEEPARCMGVVIDNVFLEGIINEAKERKEKERQTKAVPIPPPRSANPEPPASPVAGPSRPRPDTPVVFRKVDPDWTPNSTQWTWDSSWPNQKHLSGEEWTNIGRNARKEWFDEEEDDGIDWELYGDGFTIISEDSRGPENSAKKLDEFGCLQHQENRKFSEMLSQRFQSVHSASAGILMRQRASVPSAQSAAQYDKAFLLDYTDLLGI
ncbi:predicted protein [Postia placenta Mad-698-R]|nr:predicted protein [Postia placenta Mad-698-R]